MSRAARRATGVLSSAWVVVMVLRAPCGVWAEEVGSPAGILKKGQWAMEAGGGAVFGREVNPSGSKATVYQLGHRRGFGLTDWLSLYGKIGAAYLEVKDTSIKRSSNSSSTIRFNGAVLVDLQLKSRFWRHVKTGLEWDGSFQYVYLRARHRGSNDGTWQEWVGSTSVAKSMGRLTPYLGVKYSLTNFKTKIRDGSALIQRTYKNDVPVGAFFGTDLHFGPSEDVILNVETSYLGGPELDIAVKYLF
ncbi:MAG: hypothetical protein HY596_02225 [Candidatus Omnitrophica bacterium]|nr:hypothetical protein [Candidatus Omnitrophota bacterium]